jgi:hypothetical protein
MASAFGAGAPADPAQAWKLLADSISDVGKALDEKTKDAPLQVRADGYRALNRALMNLLGRLEVDDANPHLAAYNLWREKFYMDNPDCRYWLSEIAPGGVYRITGTVGDAAFSSITIYEGEGFIAKTVARMTSDELEIDKSGAFSVTLGGKEEDAEGQWLHIPHGSTMIWVRQFLEQPHGLEGDCRIERLDPVDPPPSIEAERFVARLARSAVAVRLSSVNILRADSADDPEEPNHVREWTEASGGAVYTEPGIHYQRGSWRLAKDEALVIEGKAVEARHFSMVLYSRYLNSLDYRNRRVSLTTRSLQTDADGRFQIVLAASDPETDNWLDTEGRDFGLFAIRWLQPETTPETPVARIAKLSEI